MNNKYVRYSDNLRFVLSQHFCKYKWLYVIFFAIALLGLIFGLVTGFNHAQDVNVYDIPDNLLQKFLKQNISIFGLVICNILLFYALAVFIFLINFKKFMAFLPLLIIFYKGFILGATAAILICLFDIGGFVNVFIVYLPCGLINFFAIITWSVVCVFHNWQCGKFGGCIINGNFLCSQRGLFLCLSCLILLSAILECILLPIFVSAIIWN